MANLKPLPRWLLAASRQDVLERVLAGAHRSGALVMPQGGGYRFELVHDDHPRASLGLTLTPLLPQSSAGPTAELALSLEQGSRHLADRVAALIALETELIPARLDSAARAEERGPDPAVLNHLQPDSRWQDLFLAHLKQLSECYRWWEPRAWESLSNDGVHELRVTVRRLRALLKQFAPVLPAERGVPLGKRLRWLGAVLGSARDLDIRLARCPAAEPALEAYRQHLVEERRAVQLSLVKALSGAEAQILPIELHDLVNATRHLDYDVTIADAAPANLEALIARVQALGHRTLGREPLPRAKDLHQLRLAAKRLRYGVENVAPVMGKPLIDLAHAARELQEQLGELRDAESAAAKLRAWQEATVTSRATERSALHWIERENAHARKVLKRLRRDWTRFLTRSRARILC